MKIYGSKLSALVKTISTDIEVPLEQFLATHTVKVRVGKLTLTNLALIIAGVGEQVQALVANLERGKTKEQVVPASFTYFPYGSME